MMSASLIPPNLNCHSTASHNFHRHDRVSPKLRRLWRRMLDSALREATRQNEDQFSQSTLRPWSLPAVFGHLCQEMVVPAAAAAEREGRAPYFQARLALLLVEPWRPK